MRNASTPKWRMAMANMKAKIQFSMKRLTLRWGSGRRSSQSGAADLPAGAAAASAMARILPQNRRAQGGRGTTQARLLREQPAL